MIINVYSVYDLKARCYSTPFFQHNDGVALRSFIDLVNDTRSAIYAHAEDYTLNQIGTFNDDTGELISVKPKTLVTPLFFLTFQVGQGPFSPVGDHRILADAFLYRVTQRSH